MNKKGKKRSRLRIESGSVFSDLPSMDNSTLSESLSLSISQTYSAQQSLNQQQMNYYFPVFVNQPVLVYPMNNVQSDQAQQQNKNKFDLNTFKTIECKIKTYHDHKQCVNYHSPKDRRRNLNVLEYSPNPCPFLQNFKCKDGDACKFSHNTVEQFYHPTKYKTKFCTHFSTNGTSKCKYSKFCSFAHDETELRIKLLHRKKKGLAFYLFEYKTVYCPFNHPHDKSSCEYSHNVQDFRRNPSKIAYKAEICKRWNVSSDVSTYSQGGCEHLENCKKCHGWKELEYHPDFYKTRPCANGESCMRKDCGYWHNMDDKRILNITDDKKGLIESITVKSMNKKLTNERTCSSVHDDSLFNHNSSHKAGEITLDNSIMSTRKKYKAGEIQGVRSMKFKDDSMSYNNESCYQVSNMETGGLSTLANFDDELEISTNKFNSTRGGNSKFGARGRKYSGDIYSEDGNFGHKRFCLRSVDSNSLSELATLTFISPLKMRAAFGPGNDRAKIKKGKLKSSNKKKKKDQVTRTCPTSPIPSVFSLKKAESSHFDLQPSRDLKQTIKELGLDDQKLVAITDAEIRKLEGVNAFERQQIKMWRERLIDEARERDIFRLIEDFNGNNFKKGF